MLRNEYSLQARDICTPAATHMCMHISIRDYIHILHSIHTHIHTHTHTHTHTHLPTHISSHLNAFTQVNTE